MRDGRKPRQLLRTHSLVVSLKREIRQDGQEIRVACAFAIAVDRTLDVAASGLDCGDGVCYGASAVVVRMNSQLRTLKANSPQTLPQLGHDPRHLRGKRAPVRVTQNHAAGPSGKALGHHRSRVVRIEVEAVKEVLHVNHDLAALFPQILHGIAHHRKIFLPRGAQSLLNMANIGLGHESENGRTGCKQTLNLRILGRTYPRLSGGTEGCERRVFQRGLVCARIKIGITGDGSGPTPLNVIGTDRFDERHKRKLVRN